MGRTGAGWIDDVSRDGTLAAAISGRRDLAIDRRGSHSLFFEIGYSPAAGKRWSDRTVPVGWALMP